MAQALTRVNPNRLSVAFRHPELCTRSATCVGICPEQAITLDANYYPVLDESKCTECGLCYDACPGESVSFQRLSKIGFDHEESPRDFDGHIESVHVAHATSDEIRYGGAGGGVVTALLLDMLKHGDVDGCVVTRMRKDKPWLGEPFIARSEEQLKQSQGSRYTVIPFNRVLQEIRREGGRYAVAALPCQVHGLRFAFEQDPDLRSRIPYVVGLFCGGALEPFVVPELLETKNISKEKISDFQFRGGDWPGKMRAVMKDGEIRDLHYSNYKDGAYNYFIGLYMPSRCQTCTDGSGLFSDLSVSDAWTRDKQGNYKFAWHSRILVRNDIGRQILERAVNRGTLKATNLGDDPAYLTHRQQTRRKGLNAPLRVARWRDKGLPVPDYGLPDPEASAREKLTERGVSFLLWLGKHRSIRYPLIWFLTSRYSIPLIKLRIYLKNRKYRRSGQSA